MPKAGSHRVAPTRPCHLVGTVLCKSIDKNRQRLIEQWRRFHNTESPPRTNASRAISKPRSRPSSIITRQPLSREPRQPHARRRPLQTRQNHPAQAVDEQREGLRTTPIVARQRSCLNSNQDRLDPPILRSATCLNFFDNGQAGGGGLSGRTRPLRGHERPVTRVEKKRSFLAKHRPLRGAHAVGIDAPVLLI